eukprot:TRINITY_DN45560_c0_g2_i1.p1 TRINITY_DN45560_c0_g2~~TRINITY_DN45560_c0_g2_i1.p1  ORF type:complete len:381 (-),score=67.96 TRINITY_DN45560_c0_g2_i1:57-1199(-)
MAAATRRLTRTVPRRCGIACAAGASLCGVLYCVGTALSVSFTSAQGPAFLVVPSTGSDEGLTRRDALAASSALVVTAGASALGAKSASAKEVLEPKVGIGATAILNNGMKFPKASFGLQIYDDRTAEELTKTALEVGYRNFFASVLAGNQRGFAKAVQASKISREELFICGSVVSNRARGFDAAYKATKNGCDANMKAFGVGGIDYIDQIMLDYPGPDCESIRGQWKAFEEMLAAGTTKSLAVSNFSPEQLDCLLADKEATVPTVNQLPFSISYYDPNAIEENMKRGIVVQAWSPLGGSTGGMSGSARAACEEVRASLPVQAEGKGYAPVALRWIIEKGATFTVSARSKKHFVEDFNVFDFKLDDKNMDKLNAVARPIRR